MNTVMSAGSDDVLGGRVDLRSGRECASTAAAFQDARPFRHVCLDDVLSADFVARLIEAFPRPGDAGYAEHCAGEGGGSRRNYANGQPDTFPAAFRELDAVCRDPAFIAYLTRLTGIEGLAFDPDYFGGGLRASASGAVLPPHLDFNYHPRTLAHRRLNLLLYLNPGWQAGWGGNLELHMDPNVHGDRSLVASYVPVANRMVVFETSEHSWHAFDRVHAPDDALRRAWSIYYYTPTAADAGEIAPRNTEYVEPGLPSRLRPGHVLDGDDVALLREMLERRDGRIAMLYRMRREFDRKYAHLWSEYEYYLARFRETHDGDEGGDDGARDA